MKKLFEKSIILLELVIFILIISSLVLFFSLIVQYINQLN